MYENKTLDEFCPSIGYVMTYHVADVLVKTAFNTHRFLQDDAYVTGILRVKPDHKKIKLKDSSEVNG